MSHARGRPHRRCGMTLVEVMAALALAGVLLAGAQALLAALGETDARTSQRAAVIATRGEGLRALQEALAMMRAEGDVASRFFADESGATFATLCRVAGGWLEPCAVALQLLSAEDSSVVLLTVGQGSAVQVLRLEGRARLAYLERNWEEDRWLPIWHSGRAVPIAVRVWSDRDSVVFFGGAR
jgi:prepilin-type N-terminal cleavage/methylation domain-containing protein